MDFLLVYRFCAKISIYALALDQYLLQLNQEDGPREPWHDLHCRIDGPAAYDVLTNFEERWLKASKPHGLQKFKATHDDALLKLERIPEIMGITEASRLNANDPESWHVQVNIQLLILIYPVTDFLCI